MTSHTRWPSRISIVCACDPISPRQICRRSSEQLFEHRMVPRSRRSRSNLTPRSSVAEPCQQRPRARTRHDVNQPSTPLTGKRRCRFADSGVCRQTHVLQSSYSSSLRLSSHSTRSVVDALCCVRRQARPTVAHCGRGLKFAASGGSSSRRSHNTDRDGRETRWKKLGASNTPSAT